jgi:hypothetical protein
MKSLPLTGSQLAVESAKDPLRWSDLREDTFSLTFLREQTLSSYPATTRSAMALLWKPVMGDSAPFKMHGPIIARVIAPLAVLVFIASTLVLWDGPRLTIVDSPISLLYSDLLVRHHNARRHHRPPPQQSSIRPYRCPVVLDLSTPPPYHRRGDSVDRP